MRRTPLALALLLAVGACAAPAPATQPRPSHSSPVVSPSTAPGSAPYLPVHAKTPGAINPNVTPATIVTTICMRGWTATVRPPVAYTEQVKRDEITNHPGSVSYAGVTYTVPGYTLADQNLADYELDHLIPLEIGGAAADPANLWPEHHDGPMGSQAKDGFENYLRRQVCSRRESLAKAQHDIATNWYAAYLAAGSPTG